MSSVVENVFWAVFGAIIGVPIGFLVETLRNHVRRSKKNRELLNATDLFNKRVSQLHIPMPQVLQRGPLKKFIDLPGAPDDLIIRIEQRDSPEKFVSNIIRNHEKEWEREGLYNGPMLGVKRIDFPRFGESESVALRITLTPSTYFEYLATNASLVLRRDQMNNDEKKWLDEQRANFHDPKAPYALFVNPLSVEILLLLENKRRFVIAKRSGKTAFRGGKLIPCVSECVLEKDGADNGTLDVLTTARRGLKEELGIGQEDISQLYITSLIFDSEEYDYELTAIAKTNLDENAIKTLFKTAEGRDTYENDQLFFLPFPLEKFDGMNIQETWSHQLVAAYSMAVIDQYGFKKLAETLGEYFNRAVHQVTGET